MTRKINWRAVAAEAFEWALVLALAVVVLSIIKP